MKGPNKELKAAFHTFITEKEAKMEEIKQLEERVATIKREFEENFKKEEEEKIKPLRKLKKTIQDQARKQRKELKDKQFWNKISIKF